MAKTPKTPKADAADKLPTTTSLVMNAIAAAPEGLALKDIYAAVHKVKPNVVEVNIRGVCNVAARKGTLTRSARGVYKKV